jgi:pre-60S factor REI1
VNELSKIETGAVANANGTEDSSEVVAEAALPKSGKKFPPPPAPVMVIKGKPQAAAMEVDEDDDDDEGWEEVEGDPIPITTCLFCSKEGRDVEANLSHMSRCHGFFIPDAEYCTNIEGFLEYLGEKVGEGMICLWCNEKSRQFYTVQAAQQHMQDKGHCKVLHEGEALFEYSDYYDYSSSYPDGSDANADEIYQPDLLQFNENMQLVLPSGITLGHRALKIYYKQYIRPGSQVALHSSLKKRNVLSQYRAIGYGSTSLIEAQKKFKDQKAFKHIRDKYQMKLGIKGNKILTTHFRNQSIQF